MTKKTPLSEAKKSLAGVQQALKSMSGEYALLSGYLGKISAGVNQSATVMNTFKTVMQQSGETVKNRRRNSKGSRSNEHSVNRFC